MIEAAVFNTLVNDIRPWESSATGQLVFVCKLLVAMNTTEEEEVTLIRTVITKAVEVAANNPDDLAELRMALQSVKNRFG